MTNMGMLLTNSTDRLLKRTNGNFKPERRDA